MPNDLQDDSGAHGTRHVRRVPEEDRTRDDGYLSPQRGGGGKDTALRTLKLYAAWEFPRYTLRLVTDERLTSSAIVEAMLSGRQEYEAVRFFYELCS